jgi:hypothetical protein
VPKIYKGLRSSTSIGFVSNETVGVGRISASDAEKEVLLNV